MKLGNYYQCKCGAPFTTLEGLTEHRKNVEHGITTTPPAPTPRTEDWKVSELFSEDPASHLESRGATCLECGALISDLFTHTSWHNKLLP